MTKYLTALSDTSKVQNVLCSILLFVEKICLSLKILCIDVWTSVQIMALSGEKNQETRG